VDGRNVADMSADRVRMLATLSASGQSLGVKVSGVHRVAQPVTPSPPTLGVVSRVQYIELCADLVLGYGLMMSGVGPTVVSHVDPEGPAQRAGIKPGLHFSSYVFSQIISAKRMLLDHSTSVRKITPNFTKF